MCQGWPEAATLRPGAKIRYQENLGPCDVQKRRRLVYPLTFPLLDLGVHQPCQCNELRALQGRVLGLVPTPTPQGVKSLRDQIASLDLPVVAPVDEEELIGWFASKKMLYSRIREEMKTTVLARKHSLINAFVKCEMVPTDKEPRMILARSPYYNWQLARYTKPIEKYLYNLVIRGTRAICKGLNSRERAALFHHVFQQKTNPMAISLDCKRWDQHVHQDVLKVEHEVYLQMIPDTNFQSLLELQLVNVGHTQTGLMFKSPGGRMSGDMNTALGNCLLAVMMALAATHDRPNVSILDDGDDCVLIGETEEIQYLMPLLPERYLAFGQELKVENVTTEFHQILFCQSKPNYHHGIWDFVQNPSKVLATALTVPGTYPPEQYLGTVWEARAILHQGQPYLGTYFRNCSRSRPERLDKGLTAIPRLKQLLDMDGNRSLRSWERDTESEQMFLDSWQLGEEDFNIEVPPDPVSSGVYTRTGTEWVQG